MPTTLRDVRFQGQSGKHMLASSFSGFDPGCVKTCTSRECAELFSLFSSFDGDCQSGSSVIQRYRDKPSTLKFDIGVLYDVQPVELLGAAQTARQHQSDAA
jgi:hypothetical protein